MPERSKHACHQPGCPKTVVSGAYCEEHRRQRERQQMQNDPMDKFYRTKPWQRFRTWFLREHPFCVDCDAEGRLALAEHVDHKIPRKQRPDLSLDEENCQGLCHSHHSRKTMRERGYRKTRGGESFL